MKFPFATYRKLLMEMDDKGKMEFAGLQCQKIYPRLRRLERTLISLKDRHRYWAKMYENIQLKQAQVEVITLKVLSDRMSPHTLTEKYRALPEDQRKALLAALEGRLVIKGDIIEITEEEEI